MSEAEAAVATAGDELGARIENPGKGPLYTPGKNELQLTIRALAIGCGLGALVCAMNLYFGLRTGWGIGGSLIAAILSYSFFQALGSKKKFTPLETNIAQTAASAGGQMSLAAGLVACIPAMEMLRVIPDKDGVINRYGIPEFGYVELTLWAASVAYLGVFYAVPLRRQMILVEKLRFPTGTAAAHTILAMFSSGADALRKARALLGWAIGAAIFTLTAFFFPELEHPPVEAWGAFLAVISLGFGTYVFARGNRELGLMFGVWALVLLWFGDRLPFAALGVAGGYSFSLLMSPLMFGAGILIGPLVAFSLGAGAIFSWGVLIPIVEANGWVDGPTLSYATGGRGWILWVGVSIMVADALTQLALSWKTMLNSFRGIRSTEVSTEVPKKSILREFAFFIEIGLAILVVGWLAFGIPGETVMLAMALILALGLGVVILEGFFAWLLPLIVLRDVLVGVGLAIWLFFGAPAMRYVLAGVALYIWIRLLIGAIRWYRAMTSGPKDDEVALEDPKQRIRNEWWILGLAAGTVLTAATSQIVFGIPVYLTLIAVALSAVLAMIATRATGETDINPIGGMGKVTQLVYGGIAPGNVSTNLMAAGITGAGATQAADMMQDLKTGHLLGASPRKQFIAQLVGIGVGIFICVPIYMLFMKAHPWMIHDAELGMIQNPDALPVPAAHAWKAMATLLAGGFDQLPTHAEWGVLGGLIFGILVPILRKLHPTWRFLPSGLAFGIAFIVPAFYSLAMLFGATIFMIWKRYRPDDTKALGFAIASGLIAGEGLMGIVTAVMKMAGLGPISGHF